MKHYGILILLAVMAALFVVALSLSERDKPTRLEDIYQLTLSSGTSPSVSKGDKSKSQGRAEYEWYRLRDPATGQIPRGIRSRELAFAKRLPVRSRALDEQEWISRGPFNVGGRTRALAVDVADSNRILAGGVTGGMWISYDGANTWSRTTDLAVTPSVTCLEQDRREGHTNIWYYGTGEYTGSGSRSVNSRVPQYTGDGIFKSTDNGLSWQQLASTISPVHEFGSPFDVVFRIAVNPANLEQDEVYAAAYGTIQQSFDGGETWGTVLGFFEQANYAWTDVLVTPNGTIYATINSGVIEGGLWRSEDHCATWENITPENFPSTFRRTVMAYDPSDENVLYFLSVTPGAGYVGTGGGHSLWRLTRVGGVDTWENLSANMPNFEGESPLGFGYDYHSQGGYNMVVAVHPENPEMVYIGGITLFYSRDAFNTTDSTYWIGGYNYYYGSLPGPNGMDICYPNHHADVHHMVFDPTNPDIMYCSHDGGLSKTTNSLAIPTVSVPFPWDYIDGYITTQFYWIAVDPLTEGNLRIMGGMQDNGTFMGNSESEVAPWMYMWGGDGMACDIGAAEQDNWRSFYVSTQYGGSFYRVVLDENDEFQDYYYYGPQGDFQRWITPFELTPYDYRGMFMTDVNSVWGNPDVVDNGPGGWTQITMNHSRWATALGVSNTETPVVYYGDYHPTVSDISRVYRIDEPFGATSITDVSDIDFPVQGWIHCITVDPTDANKVIVVFTNYNVLSLFYSEDGGINWSNVGGNLEENPDGSGAGPSCFWAEIVYVGQQPVYFVGTTVGLFSTMELRGDSTVWELEGADVIGYNWVTAMDVRYSDGFVGVGTHGGGTFSTYLEVSGVEPEKEKLQPTDYELTSVYPNPFNATANIMFKLPQRANLTVDVYNNLGQKVTTLANGMYEPGHHQLVFNAGDLSSGVYFVRMKAGSYDATKKIVLMK